MSHGDDTQQTMAFEEAEQNTLYASIAVPVPMRQCFTYKVPAEIDPAELTPGMRVRVPFANRSLVGIVVKVDVALGANNGENSVEASKIKPLALVAQTKPSEINSSETNSSEANSSQIQQPELTVPFYSKLFDFVSQCASYYHYPLGDALHQALPALLRQDKPLDLQPPEIWQLAPEYTLEKATSLIKDSAKKQKQLLEVIHSHGQLTWVEMRTAGFSKTQLNALEGKVLLTKSRSKISAFKCTEQDINQANKHDLTTEQAVAVSAINNTNGQFSCHLIDGITGSGKTEVYLQVIEQVLLANKQVLVLVPEIGLTPQTLKRFEQRFKVPVFLHHSGLNDTERMQTWQAAYNGSAAIIIGTRSAVFTPAQKLGLIIIDEEHDASFKQQETFRYHARDIAVLRARQLNIPIVLGSATPALESLNNALGGKYNYHRLTKRAGNSVKAPIELLDMNTQVVEHGMSFLLKKRIEQTLARGEQVLIFLNRRGYAPALSCQECHWVGNCARCEKPFTVHQKQRQLICHHCGDQMAIPPQCPECGSVRLHGLGLGTEQLEERIAEQFNDYSTVRIDRDSTRRKGSLAKLLEEVNNNEHQILIGTQMLAKGHHFPNVTLVAILDMDGALFSFDFRATEQMAQLLVQVSGRAGRDSKPGSVAVQTYFPGHPLLQDLVNNGYDHFARTALQERKQTRLPPFSFQALIRAEAKYPSYPEQFLTDLVQTQQRHMTCEFAGPVPAAMEKKAGNYRYHLIIQSQSRKELHRCINDLLACADASESKNKVRWSLDIDPQDLNW